MHILRFPHIGNKGHNAAVAPMGEGQAGFLLRLAQHAVLGSLAVLKFAAHADPLVVVGIMFFFDAVESKIEIFEANKKDLQEAENLLNNREINQATFNRLKLDENKMRDMIQGIIDIYELEDPVGKILLQRSLDTGLVLTKKSCPIGVLGI